VCVTTWAGSHSLRVEGDDSVFDSLTGLGGRVKLISDLTAALKPGNPPALLAIVYFEGFGGKTRRRDDRGWRAALVGRTTTLAQALEPAANCYRLREAEFAALVYAPAAEAFALLEQAVSLLDEGEAGDFHPVSFGTCVLPEEAAEPFAALVLAGQRLTLSKRGRESRERGGKTEAITSPR
jgi:GGDEF domain-containing protein